MPADKAEEQPSAKPVEPLTINVKAPGQCETWFAQAGITDLASARELTRRENTACDPQKYNMAGSDACGIAQELPCGKSGCGLPPNADGACQVKWQKQYVEQRYGTYANALQFWSCTGYCSSNYGTIYKTDRWY